MSGAEHFTSPSTETAPFSPATLSPLEATSPVLANGALARRPALNFCIAAQMRQTIPATTNSAAMAPMRFFVPLGTSSELFGGAQSHGQRDWVDLLFGDAPDDTESPWTSSGAHHAPNRGCG